MSVLRLSYSRPAVPSVAEVNITGKSSCRSVAPSRSKRSKTASTTRSGAALSRSILLTTRIGFNPAANAFAVTNRVCGIGPSTASTTNKTESTIDRIRSTSPPKSAWPGVSTILIRQSRCSTAVVFARMVMPRSLSSSLLSNARSINSTRSGITVCCNRRSTKVVLPWSTCAMIATLRTFTSN